MNGNRKNLWAGLLISVGMLGDLQSAFAMPLLRQAPPFSDVAPFVTVQDQSGGEDIKKLLLLRQRNEQPQQEEGVEASDSTAEQRRKQRRQERQQRQQGDEAAEQRRKQRQEQRRQERQQRQQGDEAAEQRRKQRVDELRQQRQDRREALRQRREKRAERLEDIRRQRRESRADDNTVIVEEGESRRIASRGGRNYIWHDETRRLREGARDVYTEREGNDTQTIVERPDGTRIITTTDSEGRVVRRMRQTPDGGAFVLFSNERFYSDQPLDDDYYANIYVNIPPPVITIPAEQYIVEAERAPPAVLYDTLAAGPAAPIHRRYSLDQVVNSPNLLQTMRRIDINTVTFDTGSSRVNEDQIGALDTIADAILDVLAGNPNEVFLIEGHTDAVGTEIDNLSLSDRRAEEVAYLLTEYYDVPPENLTTKGYGENYLKIPTLAAERQNRRVTMRRITPLLETGMAR